MAAVPVPVFVSAPCAEADTEAVVDAAGEELVEVAAVTPAREAISPRVSGSSLGQCRLLVRLDWWMSERVQCRGHLIPWSTIQLSRVELS